MSVEQLLNMDSEQLTKNAAALLTARSKQQPEQPKPVQKIEKIDDSISEFIRLGMPKHMLKQLRNVAKQQRISVNRLIRDAIKEFLK